MSDSKNLDQNMIRPVLSLQVLEIIKAIGPPPKNDDLNVTLEKRKGGGSNHSSEELIHGSSIPSIGDCLGLVASVSMDKLDSTPLQSTISTANDARYASLPPPIGKEELINGSSISSTRD